MRPLAIVIGVTALAGTTPVSAQVWQMFQFTGTESFQYSITRTAAAGTEQGSLALEMTTQEGQSMASVEATLGEGSCSVTVPVANQQATMPQLMMQCMVIAPVAMTMFAPAWGMLLGQQWVVGTSMNVNTGGNAMSFEITETCAYAGERGVLGHIRMTGLDIDACVDPKLPLPLAIRMNNTMDGEIIEAILTRYRP